MMKKTIAILLALVMILGLAACGNSASRTEQSSTEENSVESTASVEESVEGSNTDVENTDDSSGGRMARSCFSTLSGSLLPSVRPRRPVMRMQCVSQT